MLVFKFTYSNKNTEDYQADILIAVNNCASVTFMYVFL